jgi:dCTP deaminase
MILSNVEIQRALDEGRLIIRPEPSPRQPPANGVGECPYNTTSVDLRLGDEITIPKDDRAYNIDLGAGSIKSLIVPENYTTRKLTKDDKYVLDRGKSILAKTLEKIEFPIQCEGQQTLAARIEGRSSYARCGLLVHFTAPTIHAGFCGTITLEITNLGTAGVTLTHGVPICQLIIEEVKGTPFGIESQFQNQVTPAGT